jgi:hypothetical protein
VTGRPPGRGAINSPCPSTTAPTTAACTLGLVHGLTLLHKLTRTGPSRRVAGRRKGPAGLREEARARRRPRREKNLPPPQTDLRRLFKAGTTTTSPHRTEIEHSRACSPSTTAPPPLAPPPPSARRRAASTVPSSPR